MDEKLSENLQEQRDEILALQSIYNPDDGDRLKIISEIDEDGQGRFSIVIPVSVKPVSEQIQVHVALPCNEDEEETIGAAAMPDVQKEPPALPASVKINRSISGRNWEGAFQVKYLTPIYLYITFPPKYPSDDAPVYHMSCCWLSSLQMQALSSELNQLWQEASFMPVVYTWIDWLENNTLGYLGITDHLTLKTTVDKGSCETEEELPFDGLLPWEREIGETVASLVMCNRELMDIEFCQTQHVCEVCYDEKPGIQFCRMHDCSHKFCHECMMAFCELHVKDGTVEELRCPEMECDSLLPPYIVQAVLAPAAYERWEKLLLQKTLDAMGDTVYCPRCQSLVIREEEEDLQLANCTVCFFSFCTECRMSWHQGNMCETEEAQLETVKKKREKLSPEEQKKYDEMVRKLQEDHMSRATLKKNTRNCPSCKVPVEKIGGCNKMTCKCKASFCWICGMKINDYAHFRNSKCQLFPGQEPAVDEAALRRAMPPEAVLRIRARVAIHPELANDQARCSSCKQLNLKVNRNNHIKCWNCKSNFCFLCGVKIIGNVSKHFVGPCVQHS